jgi:hypothetical protein
MNRAQHMVKLHRNAKRLPGDIVVVVSDLTFVVLGKKTSNLLPQMKHWHTVLFTRPLPTCRVTTESGQNAHAVRLSSLKRLARCSVSAAGVVNKWPHRRALQEALAEFRFS